MKNVTPTVGCFAESKQGRDKGRFYIIKTVEEKGFVTVVDGNYKKLTSPKKKSLKHLRLLPDKAEIIAQKLIEGKQVFDSEIYSALRPYNDKTFISQNSEVEGV